MLHISTHHHSGLVTSGSTLFWIITAAIFALVVLLAFVQEAN